MSALAGVTVLSLEQATVLPFLTQRLARDGARVIRVEPPGRGDPNRHVGRDLLGEPGMASYFFANNCGKQAITLNLAEAEGRAILHKLIDRLPVDIFATNQRPSHYHKLGIDYETIEAIRPEIIWLGVTGFGPDCDEGAYDPVLQARCGWMDLTGEPEGAPHVFGLPMVDLGAAEHAYGAVMKALFRRAVTGQGSRVDISMYHSALAWMVSPVMLAALGEQVTRHGNTHPYFAPASLFPARDGYVYLAVGNDRQWEALIRLPGFEALADPAYRRNAGRIADVVRLNQRLADCTRGRTADSLIAVMTGIGVPIAKVNSLAEVLADPLLSEAFAHARDARSGLQVLLAPLAELSDSGPRELAFPPRLGEHNAAIYGDVLGYGGEDLDTMAGRGVI